MSIVLLAIFCIVTAGTTDAQVAGHRLLYVSMVSEEDAADEFPHETVVVYRGLREAVNDLKKGDEMVIAAGVYRDLIDLTGLKGAGGPTVIRGELGSEVIIKGSDVVVGWRALGGGLYVKDDWRVNSQQVYVNGHPLAQVGGEIYGGYPGDPTNELHELHKHKGIWPGRLAGDGPDDMKNSSFFYDAGAEKLYIKVDLRGMQITEVKVEVSTRTYLLNAPEVSDLHVKNIRFEHSNTSAKSRSAAVRLLGNGIRVSGVSVSRADSVGLVIRGNNNIVENSLFEYNGRLGMAASGHNVRLINNTTSYNNTRGFNTNWAAGGAKFVGDGGLQNSLIDGHVSYANNGDGIWFDWKNRGNVVSNSVIAGNKGHGLHYEASFAGEFHDNLIFDNVKRGIYLPNSSDCSVHHNLVVLNGLEQVASIYSGRKDPQGTTDFSVYGNRIWRNVIAWGRTKRPVLVLPRELADNSSNENIFIDSENGPAFSLGWAWPVLYWRANDLQDWTRLSGQDGGSLVIRSAVPDSLFQQSMTVSPYTDFGVVESLVERAYREACGISQTGTICKGRLPGPASYYLAN